MYVLDLHLYLIFLISSNNLHLAIFDQIESCHPLTSRVLKCQSCRYPVTSEEHMHRCITSSMYQVNQRLMSDNFKPMMTFGLCGCTALLMVFFTKDTNTVFKVVLGHDPSKESILSWFTRYYTEDYNIVTIIKHQNNI
jgi:hypothetical protein